MTDLIKTAEDNIISHLRTEISDPISRTIGQFVEHGKGHYKGKTPRILVRRRGEVGSNFNGVGDKKQDYDVRFEIVVEVAASVTGTVNSTQYSGNELCNIISDRVSQAMEEDITGIKQTKRESSGPYEFSDVHYYVHIYDIYVIND